MAQLTWLTKCPKLTRLNIAGNDLGPAGVQVLVDLGLIGLTSLNIRDNMLLNQGVKALSNMAYLTSLDLSCNNIGDAGVQFLVEARLIRLKSLNVAWGAKKLAIEAWNKRKGEYADRGYDNPLLAAAKAQRDRDRGYHDVAPTQISDEGVKCLVAVYPQLTGLCFCSPEKPQKV